jgi:hypothetical protein
VPPSLAPSSSLYGTAKTTSKKPLGALSFAIAVNDVESADEGAMLPPCAGVSAALRSAKKEIYL